MRIVVATGIDRKAQHFAGTLIRRFGEQVAGVVFQRPPDPAVRRRRGSSARMRRGRRVADLLREGAPDAAAVRRRMFSVDEAALGGFAGRMWTTYDIHHAETVEAIRRLEPEVICLLGGAVLGPEILDIPPRGTLNVHTGRLPLYCGVRCTEWTILNDDLENLAVTVHFVEARVDRGRIVAQDTVQIEADDDEVSLEGKLIHAGIERLCDTLLRMQLAGRVRTRPVTEPGRLYLGRHWSGDLYVQLRRRISNGAIRRYVQSKQTPVDRAADPEQYPVSC